MAMNTVVKDKKVLVSIDRGSIVFQLIIVLMLAGLAINFFTEFQLGGFSRYAVKHLVVFSTVLIFSVFWRLKWVSSGFMLILIAYINVLSSTVYLPFRISDTQLNFEGYFLRVEIMIFVMALILGVFARLIHQIIIIIYNTLYIVACASFGPSMPTGKYVLAFLLVSSVGAISYLIFREIIALRNSLEKRNQKITKQNNELQELTSFRKEIVQIIAHDLKAPIKQISVLTDIAKNTKTLEEKDNCLVMLKQSSEKTHTMLEGLLEWALQNNELRKTYTEVNVHDVIKEITEGNSENLNQKKLVLENKVDQGFTLFFSKQVLETVLRNLLTNAVKFSPSNENVRVTAKADEKSHSLLFYNKALDVDCSKLEQINRGEAVESSSGTNGENGSGKGLSFCHQLLVKNNASLKLHCKDNGVVAMITIPKKASYQLGQGISTTV